MSNEYSTGQTVQTSAEMTKPNMKRRRPKTPDEQLADLMAKAETLKAKALEQRGRLHSELIEDLFRKHGIGEIDGDVSQRQRLAVLRRKLSLES